MTTTCPPILGDLPYPPSLRDREDNRKAAQQEMMTVRLYSSTALSIRWTVKGHSDHCSMCVSFTRSGGGCPGVAGTDPRGPICLVRTWDELLARAERDVALMRGAA